jgi:glycosyltransferase involved in cell wall biosynthesis
MTVEVQVALATFNGASWLDEQLHSIATQTIPAQVIVGDDQSNDATLEILRAWGPKMPGGMKILPSVDARLGAKNNFNRVLTACTAPWVACCDQDDVWLPDHLELLCDGGRATLSPVLNAGDLQVCNSTMKPLHTSFRRMQAFDATRCKDLRTLTVMNVFPGCAMAFTKPLLKLALPIPSGATQHDWWLALCATTLGTLNVIEQPVIKYRLHEGNAIGAKRFNVKGLLSYFILRGHRLGSELDRCAEMSAELIGRHQGMMSTEQLQVLNATVALKHVGMLSRWLIVRKSGIRRLPWQRQAKMIFYG